MTRRKTVPAGPPGPPSTLSSLPSGPESPSAAVPDTPDRPIDRLVNQAGFEMARLERFLMPKAPRVLAELYRGAAVAP